MRKIAISAFMVMAMLITTLGPADAHFDTGAWTHYKGGKSEDPVNVIFRQNATSGNVRYNLIAYSDFTWPGGNNDSYFKDHGRLHVQNVTLATDKVWSPRWHIRTKQGMDRGRDFGIYSAGSAHWDHVTYNHNCQLYPIFGTHVARNYNAARYVVVTQLHNAALFRWYEVYLPKTAGVSVQCDGSKPRGDGFQARMYMP